jgi:hypothetical protein
MGTPLIIITIALIIVGLKLDKLKALPLKTPYRCKDI